MFTTDMPIYERPNHLCIPVFRLYMAYVVIVLFMAVRFSLMRNNVEKEIYQL